MIATIKTSKAFKNFQSSGASKGSYGLDAREDKRCVHNVEILSYDKPSKWMLFIDIIRAKYNKTLIIHASENNNY